MTFVFNLEKDLLKIYNNLIQHRVICYFEESNEIELNKFQEEKISKTGLPVLYWHLKQAQNLCRIHKHLAQSIQDAPNRRLLIISSTSFSNNPGQPGTRIAWPSYWKLIAPSSTPVTH